MAKKLLISLALTMMFVLNACSLFGGASEPEGEVQQGKEEAAVVAKEATAEDRQVVKATAEELSKLKERSSVELLWQAPGEAVNTYHIRYGYQEDKLETHLEVPVEKLEKLDDPVQGPLYRYVIPGVSGTKRIHFTVQAENQYGTSRETDIFTVDPQ